MAGINISATGALSITEARLNQLLGETISGETAVSCQCEDQNCLRLTIVTKTQGVIQLKLGVIEVKHDPYNTTIKVKLMERRLEGNPLKAVLFACAPDSALNFLLKLFALPPTIMVKNSGDVYTVELHEWLLQSPLAEKAVLGERILDCIKVGGVTVTMGRICIQGRFDFAG